MQTEYCSCSYDELLSRKKEILFEKNSIIIHAAKKTDSFFYLKSGVAATVDLLENGNERIYRYHNEGEFLGMTGVCHNDVAHNDIIAKTDCLCIPISAVDYLDFACNHPEALITQVCMMDQAYLQVVSRNPKMRSMPVPGLLCEALFELSVPLENGTRKLHGYFTNEEFSRYLGIHPVTVSRIIQELIRNEVIARVNKQIIILNVDAIKRYAHGEPLSYKKGN